MNAERIAELRDQPRSVHSPVTELLDEIERLQRMIGNSHRLRVSVDDGYTTTGFGVDEKARCERYIAPGVKNCVKYTYRWGCWTCSHLDYVRVPVFRSWDAAEMAARAHVVELLDGAV